ncbi:Hypothetical predicted protein [Cloeon dipterum]|uniref:DNA/RNA non-specific endonuclease domain-containing protein n=1 Tax=Cloeon dipterum TaxID=197152 RepID=A0A8S1EBX3_9INSE|nr:Hypothetical predicted protein [Cloeon dipterum]
MRVALVGSLLALFFIQQSDAAKLAEQKCNWLHPESFENEKNPLYLTHPGKDVLQPILVACPGSNRVCSKDFETISTFERYRNLFVATCDNGEMIPHIENPEGLKLGDLICCSDLEFDEPKFIRSRMCEGQSDHLTLINFGFDVLPTGHSIRVHKVESAFRFTTLLSCYDKSKKRALYSIHKYIKYNSLGVKGTGIGYQKFDRKPFDSVFDADKDYLYTLYKDGEQSRLNRGHLTPAADFAFFCLRNQTYFYQNVAPQLEKRNKEWGKVEESIREDYETAVVVTGTSSKENNAKYLRTEGKYKHHVLIPDLFWKIVFISGTEMSVYILPNTEKAEGMETFNKIFGTETAPEDGYSSTDENIINDCRKVIPEMDRVLREIEVRETPEEFWERITKNSFLDIKNFKKANKQMNES